MAKKADRKAIAEIYPDKKRGKKGGKLSWRWHLKANGNIMADSGQGYSRRRQARRSWDRFAQYIAAGNVVIVELNAKGKADVVVPRA
jgi:uncharacterized protein YegP (UPF0339 family)